MKKSDITSVLNDLEISTAERHSDVMEAITYLTEKVGALIDEDNCEDENEGYEVNVSEIEVNRYGDSMEFSLAETGETLLTLHDVDVGELIKMIINA